MSSYRKTVDENMKFMKSSFNDWVSLSALGEDEEGKYEFDIPVGYTTAPSLFKDKDKCCNLCGTDIKNVFYIKNDIEKWIMPVGSECVTYFENGLSGKKKAKSDIHAMNREIFNTVLSLKKEIWKTYAVERHIGYGRKEKSIRYQGSEEERKAYLLYESIKSILGNNKEDVSDTSISRLLGKKEKEISEFIEQAKILLGNKKEYSNGPKL